MIKNIYKYFILFAVVLLALSACEDDNDGVGNPSVGYVRLITDESAITSAEPGTDIVIIGSDLQELTELYFNGLEATLKRSFITSNSVVTTIPDEYPDGESVNDTMTLVFSNGKEVAYPFEVTIPGPSITSASSKYDVDGTIAVIMGTGFHLTSDSEVPEVTFAGDLEGEILEYSNTQIQVRIPDGAVSGDITVTTEYGKDTVYLEITSTIILEAEDGDYSSDLSVSTETEGYSGTGYLTYFGSSASYVTVSVNLASAADYVLSVGYTTSGWGYKEIYVAVNDGSPEILALTDASGFDESEFASVSLNAGTNTITITPSWTWFSIDYIKLVPVE